MTLRKVVSGQPFHPRAEEWNAFIEAAIDHRQRLHRTGSAPALGSSRSGVLVWNQSGHDQDQFAAMRISGVVTAPVDAESGQRFCNQPLVFEVTAFDQEHLDDPRFAILQEPLAHGKVGRAIVNGVTPTRMRVADLTHRFAVPDLDGKFVSADLGPCLVIWQASDAEECWAVILVGHGGGQAGGGMAWASITAGGPGVGPYTVDLWLKGVVDAAGTTRPPDVTRATAFVPGAADNAAISTAGYYLATPGADDTWNLEARLLH